MQTLCQLLVNMDQTSFEMGSLERHGEMVVAIVGVA